MRVTLEILRVDRLDRSSPLVAILGVGELDLPLFLKFVREVDLGFPKPASLVLSGFDRGALDQLLFVRVQRFPELLAREDDAGRVKVPDHADVRLNGEVTYAVRHDDAVVLSVHEPGLKAAVDFTRGDRRRQGAERLVHVGVHVVHHGTNLEALDVGEGVDRTFVVRDLAPSVLVEGDGFHLGAVEFAQDLISDGAHEDGVDVFGVAEQKGHVEKEKILHESREAPRREPTDVEVSCLQHLRGFDLVARHISGEDLNLDLATRLFFEYLFEFVRTDVEIAVARKNMGKLDRLFTNLRRLGWGDRKSCKKRHRKHCKHCHDSCPFHVSLSLCSLFTDSIATDLR